MNKQPKTDSAAIFSAEAIESEIKREKYKLRYKRILKSAVYSLIVVAAIAALIATLVLPVLQISGTSMEPTLNNGEIVVLFKTSHLKRGDCTKRSLRSRPIGLIFHFSCSFSQASASA